MDSQKIRKISATFIGVLLLIYVAYQFHMATKKGMETETVTYASVEDSIQVKALALREETVIEGSGTGLLSYVVADGTNVSKDSVIAQTYPNEAGAAAQTQLSRLDSEISVLEKLLSPGDNYISNPGLIGTQIYTALDELCQVVPSGDFSNLSTKRDTFHLALSRKNIIAGFEKTEDYSTRLDTLKSERETLSATAENKTNEITSPVAGYFSNEFDGFQNQPSLEEIKSLSVEEIKALMEKEKKSVSENTVGKVITGFNWYFVAVLSKEETLKMQGLQNVDIQIPFSTTEKIPAEIVYKTKNSATGETAFVFACDNMSPEIAKIRNETIKITLATYQGLLVNERSILFEDYEEKRYNKETDTTESIMHEKVKGVYIKNGAKVKFVQIFSDKTMNGYAICKTTLSEEEENLLVTGSTIRLYDEVIMGGTDLYDGKLIL
ncbi:HlyD family efflux transporter periplasmic adaptor subunit [Scatolibacter rhodanostii]|uniref:HlyD family efflux transporter periplasmic adaptor subunit n=1 Tax=Scatolibacter rhodanostii TaxID=2014781 RepID=UPI000C077879|nr:HlyD family efflux transporter periplasmic adaptor subunit [Scatolibacter rhodanostii]